MKKTKVICTIGPACDDIDTMIKMSNVGMNVVRINFSHSNYENRERIVKNIDELRKQTGKHIGLLFDTKGPEFRNMEMEANTKLIDGSIVRIVKQQVIGNSERFSVNYPQALDSIEPEKIILLENGLMRLDVISKEDDGITCRVVNGGILGNHKSLNVPSVHLNIPFVGKQDKEDIEYAIKHHGNFLALSFVSDKDDILEVKKILEQNNSNIKIISKIENITGINNIDSILELSDGVMVARGDLGVEVPMEELPIYQKMIINKCRRLGKICIVATEMLESMKYNIRPTRAEVTDVANAVLDGTDAVMLSGETAVGKYPIETVRVTSNVCENTEKYIDYKHVIEPTVKIDITDTIAHNAVLASRLLNAKLIVATTMTGYTACKISTLKPRCVVLAACTNDEIAYSLSLNFGIYTTILPVYDSTDDIVSNAIIRATETMNLDHNDVIVITGGFPNDSDVKITNFMKIEQI